MTKVCSARSSFLSKVVLSVLLSLNSHYDTLCSKILKERGMVIFTIFCIALSKKARPFETPATIKVLVRRLNLYFSFYCSSKRNKTGGDLRCRRRSKQLDIWYAPWNAHYDFINFKTKNCSSQYYFIWSIGLELWYYYVWASNKFGSLRNVSSTRENVHMLCAAVGMFTKATEQGSDTICADCCILYDSCIFIVVEEQRGDPLSVFISFVWTCILHFLSVIYKLRKGR